MDPKREHDLKIFEKTRLKYYEHFKDIIPDELIKSSLFSNQFRKYVIDILVHNHFKLNNDKLKIEPIIYFKDRPINMANVIISGKRSYIIPGDVPASADGEFRPTIGEFANLSDSNPDTGINEERRKIIHKFILQNKNYLIYDKDLNLPNILFNIFNHIFSMFKRGYPLNFAKRVYTIIKPYLNKWRDTELTYSFELQNMTRIHHRTGCKIIPLYINDIKNFKKHGNLLSTEIEINRLISDLKRSCILFNCPILSNWGLFKLNNIDIFSSSDLRDKYKNSDIYLKTIKKLYEAGHIEGEIELIKTFRKKIEVPILYAEKNMILSNYCTILIFETVGTTLTDSIIQRTDAKESTFLSSVIESKAMLFQLLYTLYCLNEHVKIIHGDLHFNNITITMALTPMSIMWFTINNKDYSFCPDSFYYIIDYGRAIRDPTLLIEKKMQKEYIELQNKRLLKFIGKVMPEMYAENKYELSSLIVSNAKEIFHIAKAFDILYVVSNIKTILSKYMNPEVRDLFSDINKILVSWIRENVINLIARKPIDEINPNLMLIEKLFTPSKPDKIDKIYVYCNADSKKIISRGTINISDFTEIKKPDKDEFSKNLDKITREVSGYYKHTLVVEGGESQIPSELNFQEPY